MAVAMMTCAALQTTATYHQLNQILARVLLVHQVSYRQHWGHDDTHNLDWEAQQLRTTCRH